MPFEYSTLHGTAHLSQSLNFEVRITAHNISSLICRPSERYEHLIWNYTEENFIGSSYILEASTCGCVHWHWRLLSDHRIKLVTNSHATVVEADDETMQLSIAHGSVVSVDDASASPRSMATHISIHTRITGSRRGGSSQARESEVANEKGGGGGGGGGQESARRSSYAGTGVTEQTKRARSVRRKNSS